MCVVESEQKVADGCRDRRIPALQRTNTHVTDDYQPAYAHFSSASNRLRALSPELLIK